MAKGQTEFCLQQFLDSNLITTWRMNLSVHFPRWICKEELKENMVNKIKNFFFKTVPLNSFQLM